MREDKEWTIELALGLLTIGAMIAIAHCAAPHQYDIKSHCVQGKRATACAAYNKATDELTVQVLDDGE